MRRLVGVMGSGTEEWLKYAEPLGRFLGESGFNILTGAGKGAMRACARSFARHRTSGISIGIVPTIRGAEGTFEPKKGYPNEFIDFAIITPLGSYSQRAPSVVSRNYVNVLSSDVLVALPGNEGTEDEISLALRFSKPIILFGPLDEFAGFPAVLPRTDQLCQVQDFIISALA